MGKRAGIASKRVSLLELFLVFLRVGCTKFTGYAILPVLEREVIERRGWITRAEAVEFFAIGQTTPGIIAVNVSTFTGCKVRGTLGGIVASLGFAAPSLVLVSVLATCVGAVAGVEVVEHAFAGIRVAVCALLVSTTVKMWREALPDAASCLIFAGCLVASVVAGAEPVLVVVCAGLVAVVWHAVRRRAR